MRIGILITLKWLLSSQTIESRQVQGQWCRVIDCRTMKPNFIIFRAQSSQSFDENLIIKHGDVGNSEALLVYTTSNNAAAKYAGCVVTQLGKSDSICPLQHLYER